MNKLIALLIMAFLLQHYASAQCGTANLASGQQTDASTYLDQFSIHDMAVDGNPTTMWKSGTSTTQWIKVNLGQAYSICRVKLRWATDFYFATHYTIEVSSDDQNWTTFGTVSGAANNNGEGGIDEITATATAKWVRISCTQRSAAWADKYELFELEVYGGTIPPPNSPPTVSIVTPPNNVPILAGGNVLVEANAADADGIQKVEFYSGTALLGFDNSAPYQYTMTTPPAGQYTLTAKAFDNNGNTTVSNPVSITITSSGSGWLLTGNGGTTPGTNFVGTTDQKDLVFKTGGEQRMVITAEGKVLINTTVLPTNSDAHLAVKGNIWAQKLKVTQTGWADFVFDSSYKLMALDKVAAYIAQHKHLPDVPSAKEVEKDGLNVGDNQALLLRKIEELTLYMIEQDRKMKQLEEQVRRLKAGKKEKK